MKLADERLARHSTFDSCPRVFCVRSSWERLVLHDEEGRSIRQDALAMNFFLLSLIIALLLICAFAGRGKSAPLKSVSRPANARREPFEECLIFDGVSCEQLWRDDAHRSEL